MSKFLIILLPLILLCGCDFDKPEVISEVDGIKLYRVSNGLSTVYFTKRSTDWDESCGKACVKHMHVEGE